MSVTSRHHVQWSPARIIERWARLTLGEPARTSVARSPEVSSQPPERFSGCLSPPTDSSSLCFFPSHAVPRISPSLGGSGFSLRDGNERVRTERRVEEPSPTWRKKERWANVLLVPHPPPPPLSHRLYPTLRPIFSSVFFPPFFSRLPPVFLRFFHSLLSSPSSRGSTYRRSRGVTEITHTLVANQLDCDSLLRLYLASNCSFLRDARRSARLPACFACLPDWVSACLPTADPLAPLTNLQRVTWEDSWADRHRRHVPAAWKLAFLAWNPVNDTFF